MTRLVSPIYGVGHEIPPAALPMDPMPRQSIPSEPTIRDVMAALADLRELVESLPGVAR